MNHPKDATSMLCLSRDHSKRVVDENYGPRPDGAEYNKCPLSWIQAVRDELDELEVEIAAGNPNMAGEFGDVQQNLFHVAYLAGIDPVAATLATLRKVTARMDYINAHSTPEERKDYTVRQRLWDTCKQLEKDNK